VSSQLLIAGQLVLTGRGLGRLRDARAGLARCPQPRVVACCFTPGMVRGRSGVDPGVAAQVGRQTVPQGSAPGCLVSSTAEFDGNGSRTAMLYERHGSP
jgi:hypothetical protein